MIQLQAPSRTVRRSKPAIASRASSAVFVPLFHAALLYLAGIVFGHSVYLRPGLLLAGLVPLAAVTIIAILRAPRLTWLGLAAVWLVLGAWSAETEPQPAPSPAVNHLTDGLIRIVEGTITSAGPLHSASSPAPDDADPRAEADSFQDQSAPGSATTQQATTQQIDLQLTAVESLTDSEDRVLPISPAPDSQLRLSLRWPSLRAAQSIACGQRIRAVIRLTPAEVFHDPGVWNRTTYLESRQIFATGSINAAHIYEGLPSLQSIAAPATTLPCLLNGWRAQTTASLESLPALTAHLPRLLRATPEDAAMLAALLTGDRGFLTRSLRTGFERTGTFHLIVVSGLHLAILAGCVFTLGRRLHLGRLWTTLLTLALTLAYAAFTGFAIPAQRSFWMIALYLLGRLLYRDRSPLNVIGFAVLCLAAASPRSIFDASLQMTVLSVAAIAGIAVPLLATTLHARLRALGSLRLISLDPRLPPKIAQFRVTIRLIAKALEPATTRWIAWELFPAIIRLLLRVGEALVVTAIVELALALPMAIYFHRITLYALPVNLLILPVLGLLVPAAMLLLPVLKIWTAAAGIAAIPCLALLHVCIWLVHRLGSLANGDWRVAGPGAAQIAAALALFVAAVFVVRLGPLLPWARRPMIVAAQGLLALVLMAAVSLAPRPIAHPANAMLFEAVDVGQGDCLLLISPEGKTLLIDSGGLGIPTKNESGASQQATGFDVGEEVVSATLWARGISRLDAVALSHAHHDHMGGMSAIMRNFHPREFWVGNNPPDPAYLSLLEDARRAGTMIRPLRAGNTLALGSVQFQVLAPDAAYRPGPVPVNNDSLVLRARLGETSILLTGDAESPEEEAILARENPATLRSTLLKVGHHGSATSTRPALLAAVQPAWAVISCGLHNRFGHPRGEVLAELEASGTRTFRTDIDGASCFALDGRSVTPQPMCAP